MNDPLSKDQSSCLPTEEEQRAGLTRRGSLTSNDVVQRLRALCGCKACCLEAADEITRLRAALDFYADESNWIDKHSHIPYCDVDRDMGMRAREALKDAVETRP